MVLPAASASAAHSPSGEPPLKKPLPPLPEPDGADINAEFIEVMLLFIECINAYVENLPLVKVPP